MKNIIQITLKIFLVFLYIHYLSEWMSSLKSVLRFDGISLHLFFLLCFDLIIRTLFYIFIWINNENISKKIIGNENNQVKYDSINNANIITIGMIIFALYLIITFVPFIFTNISSIIFFAIGMDFFDITIYYAIFSSLIQNIFTSITTILIAYIVIKYSKKLLQKTTEEVKKETE